MTIKPLPLRGSLWQHCKTGRYYVVEAIYNIHTTQPESFPVTVAYRDDSSGYTWCRPLVDFEQKMKPRVTSIRYFSGPVRRQPQAGDLRETKALGKQVRVHERSQGMLVRNGSRYRFEWVSYAEARRRGDGHLVPDASPGNYPAGYMQGRGAA